MIDPLRTYVQQVEDENADWFWSDTLNPVTNIFAVDEYEALVEDGQILDYESALTIAQAMDDEGPFGPDYARG